MPNPHLTATGDPWTGSSTPTVTRPSSMPPMLSWTGGQGQGSGSTTTNVVDTRGNGNDGRGSGNDGRGDGIGVNTINQVIENPITVDTTPTSTKPNSVTNVYGEEVDLTNISDDIWNLAKQAADPITNPGYALSYEGQLLKDRGILPGSDRWVAHFGIPQIVTTSGRTGKPILSTHGDNPIMTGQGKYLMDQYDEPKTYEEKVDAYYKMREAEQAQQTGGDQGYGYGYGSSGGGGYSMAGVHPRSFYKGLPYQDFSGKEVHKMLDFYQKVEGANIISGLSQDAKAFDMDPKARGILAMLQA